MSVCFFVPADQVAASSEEVEGEPSSEESKAETAEQTLQQYWNKVMEDIKNSTAEDFKTQPLPLTRIKKIMKLDDEVKMISAEAPVLFAKAAEIFIHELTLRAWTHTEDNKRRTLQRNDIAMAISKSDQFDFLIDIVPRHEMKPNKPRFDTVWSGKSEQSSSPASSTSVQTVSQQQLVVQPQACSQLQVQAAGGGVQQPLILQQLVQGGDVANMPSQIQLTPAQLNMIRLQVQNNPTQPIIIQAQAQHSPQIIQVSSQGQHQPQQQVYLAQVASTQEDS